MIQVVGRTSLMLSVLPPSRILGTEIRDFPEALKYDIKNLMSMTVSIGILPRLLENGLWII